MIESLSVRSLLDAGCGALEWQPSLLRKFYATTGKQIRYHGADIVPGKLKSKKNLLVIPPYMCIFDAGMIAS